MGRIKSATTREELPEAVREAYDRIIAARGRLSGPPGQGSALAERSLP